MSPDDYRVWLARGRALDRGGDVAGARAAFERAIELAPNHFDPRWSFGNYLLRAGDREGSFAQMRLALSNRPSALPLIFDSPWGVYRGDGKAIAAALDPPDLADLADLADPKAGPARMAGGGGGAGGKSAGR